MRESWKIIWSTNGCRT